MWYREVVIRSNMWVCIRFNKCGSIRSLFFGFAKRVFIRSIFFFYFDMVSLFSEKIVYAFFAEMRSYKACFQNS